jgi:hypothetical protein
MVAVILTFISTLVPFYITQINDNQYKQFEVPSYLLMLVSILTFIFSKEVFIMQETMRALTVLVIYIVLAIAYRNRKVLYTISTIATVVPFNIFLRYIDVSNNTNEIIQSAFYLILVPLLCRNIEKLQDRDTVSTILYIYIMLPVIFTDGLEIGLYVGFVSLLMILFGFIKKGYRLMFRLGVTITIVNIIFQLRELWLKIPFWLYLLLAGMILIGLVMYKAINKMKK